ncbi:MAG: tripartite tricarboxylate transporter TctB family protein [Pseudomonadota bacterium]
MRIGEICMAIALALLSLFIMWEAGETPVWKGERFSNIGFDERGVPGGGFWPFWLSAIMLVCSIWVLIQAIRGKTPPSQKREPFLDGHGIGVVVKMGGGVLGMVALTEIISMYFAMAAFLLYYLFLLGRHTLVLSLAMAVVVPFWMYLFFDITMTKTLPKGLLAVENAIFVPMDTLFRGMGQIPFALCFLLGGAILVIAARYEASRRPGPEA